MNYHPHDHFHVTGIIERLPYGIRSQVENTYSHTYDTQCRREANLYLLDVKEKAAGKPLITLDDETLRKRAERMADLCQHHDTNNAAHFLESMGLKLPVGESRDSVLARVRCAIWWERQLRRQQDRQQEQLFNPSCVRLEIRKNP